jgi:SAM-dependent methyltransferase
MPPEGPAPAGAAAATAEAPGPEIRCPICRCEDAALACLVGSRPLLVCRDCRHLRWMAMPSAEELTAYYAREYSGTHGQQDLQEGHLEYYRGHVAELAGLAGGPAGGVPVRRLAIADIGCSFPVLLAQAVAAGCPAAIGVDWSEEARDYGARRGVPVLTPDAFLREVPDGSLDVLRYSHTLEHLPDPAAVLRAQAAKLRPGGLLYITQPNAPMLRFGAAPAPFDAVYPTHLHFFTPASAVALAEGAGCAVERFYTVAEPEAVSERHRAAFDLEHAVVRLAALEGRGEPERGPLNNYPFFFGRNSAVYARRRGGDAAGTGAGAREGPPAALVERLKVLGLSARAP